VYREVEEEMSDEEFVKAKEPQAHVSDVYKSMPCFIMGTRSRKGYSYAFLGQGDTPVEAWADARRRLEEK
jgi:hypothetical protein